MRYLQLLLFFTLVIVSYRFMGSPLPRVASEVIPTEIENLEAPPTDAEIIPSELPNE